MKKIKMVQQIIVQIKMGEMKKNNNALKKSQEFKQLDECNSSHQR